MLGGHQRLCPIVALYPEIEVFLENFLIRAHRWGR